MEYSANAEDGIQDMIDIDELNHATLLFNLRNRYFKDLIFTYVGPTLLVVNPFKRMGDLYTDESIDEYYKIYTAPNILQQKREMMPHIFAVACTSFRQLMESK